MAEASRGVAAPQVRLLLPLGGGDRGPQEGERRLVGCGDLISVVHIFHFLQGSYEEHREDQQSVHRLAPDRHEDVEASRHREGTDEFVRFGQSLPANDDGPLCVVEALDVSFEQGPHAFLAAHGLQRLHAVQTLQEQRHEGFLEVRLILPRTPAHGDQPVQGDHAEGADGEGEQRDLPGYRHANRQVDEDLKRARQNVAGAHVGIGCACRLHADRACQIAGAPVNEVQPARPQNRADERETQVHRDMGCGVPDLRHRQQHQQRFERHGDDHQNQQPTEGHVLAG